MSTADNLLLRMEERCRSLWQWDGVHHRADRVESGWPSVADAASRVLNILEGDPHAVAALSDLAALSSASDPDHRMVQLAEILGAFADLLSAQIDTVHGASVAERSRAAARIQASLNAAARASLWRSAQPTLIRDALADLQDATELAAGLPTHFTRDTLENLSIQPDPARLPATVEVWARAALPILVGNTQLTGYAMQSTALVIASLCDVSVQSLHTAARKHPDQLQPPPTPAIDALTSASERWREAAAWPAHLRLGGRSPQLRQATAHLAKRLRLVAAEADLPELESSLRLALPVATAHARGMHRLHDQGQLWVAVASLPDRYQALRHGTPRSGWVLEPGRKVDSGRLAAASEVAREQLDHCMTTIRAAIAVMSRPALVEPVWESVSPVRTGRHTEDRSALKSPRQHPNLTL